MNPGWISLCYQVDMNPSWEPVHFPNRPKYSYLACVEGNTRWLQMAVRVAATAMRPEPYEIILLSPPEAQLVRMVENWNAEGLSVRLFQERLPRMRGAVCNSLVKLARGSYLHFLNLHGPSNPEYIRTLFQTLDTEQSDIAYGNVTVGAKVERSILGLGLGSGPYFLPVEAMAMRNPGYEPFDERLPIEEGTALVLKAAKFSQKISKLNTPVAEIQELPPRYQHYHADVWHQYIRDRYRK
jgi:hypothetical protein